MKPFAVLQGKKKSHGLQDDLESEDSKVNVEENARMVIGAVVITV